MSNRAANSATSDTPSWRPFAALSFAEAAFVACRSSCDPSTMLVTCRPGTTSFAVAGQDPVHGWHWAIFSVRGIKLDDGWELAREEAQRAALEARGAWAHRCAAPQRCCLKRRQA